MKTRNARTRLATTLVMVAALLTMATSAAQAQVLWDYTDVSYGPETRQWIHIAVPGTPAPSGVFFWAHPMGNTPDSMTQESANAMLDNGYAVVSWNSILAPTSESDTATAWADAQLVFDFVRANAATWNMDPDRIIIGGRSRGSIVSWPLAQSGHPAIVGIYMYNALPAQVWGQSGWSPVDEVTSGAPPTYLVYGPEWGSTDAHAPDNVLPVKAAYDSLGIGDRFTLYEDMWGDFRVGGWNNEYFQSHYFPELVASLGAGPPPGDWVEDFEGGNPTHTWTENGPWYVGGGTYNQDDVTSSRSALAGEAAWSAYTLTADMITTGTGAGAANWMTSSLAFRVSDDQNNYRVRLNGDGTLKLFSYVNGAKSTIASVATPYDPFEWHTYRVVLDGDAIEISVDGEVLIDINDSDHATGYIGVFTSLSSVSLDDVSVTTDTAPAQVPTGNVFIDTAADFGSKERLYPENDTTPLLKGPWSGARAQWIITPAGDGNYFIDNAGADVRLQGKSNGDVALVSTSKTGNWVRWSITGSGNGSWFIDRVGADPSAARLRVNESNSYIAELVDSSSMGTDAQWILTQP